jgi:hypothetical protein
VSAAEAQYVRRFDTIPVRVFAISPTGVDELTSFFADSRLFEGPVRVAANLVSTPSKPSPPPAKLSSIPPRSGRRKRGRRRSS